MKTYGLMFILLVSVSVRADYRRLTDYAQEFYARVATYVQENPTVSSADILSFINSSLDQAEFTDAKSSGYTREQLIFSTYQNSFGADNANPLIINALHDAYTKEKEPSKIAQYVSWITTGASGISLMYLAGFSYMYFKRDRKAINHYRNNAHAFVNQLRVNTNLPSTNTNASTETNPLIPEPFFQLGQ